MIFLTKKAVEQVKNVLKKSNALGLRLRLEKKGCSGFAYVVEYAKKKNPLDEVVEQDGLKIFIDVNAQMMVAGSIMDYIDDTFASGFVFRNPNEKGRCGCGESFTI